MPNTKTLAALKVAYARSRGAVALALALTLVLAMAVPARAQSISGASASTSGSTGDGGDSDGSIRSSVAVQVNSGTQLKTRFAWNINADTTVFSTRDTNGTAKHNVSFNVTAPGAYYLTVDTQRKGDMNRINDASGCDGSADISSVTGSQTGGSITSGSLGLSDPGSIPVGGSTTSGPFDQTATARIDGTSNGVAKGHTLAFTWTGSTRSNSCEAAVRVGEGNGSTSGCDACSYPGNPSRTQASDGHFATVTLTSLCGNGVVDSAQGEDCDIGIAGSICCDSACQFKSASNQCRASAGVCDAIENCTGSGAACPNDGFQPTSTVCRASAGICDVAENCTGSSAACPANGFAPTTTVCRASNGVCDVAERCTGSGSTCPADGFAGTATVCRAAVSVCDVAEYCTGGGVTCPTNGFASSATVCRGAVDVCDVEENCTGSSSVCPTDDYVSAATICRATVGVCDLTENCTGSGPSCPADAKSTAVCRPPTDVCDAADSCDGFGDDCPADLPASPSTVCRPATGVCDVAEQCDGVNLACPVDGKSTVVCRPAADVCDVAESCDGLANDCPTDAFESSSVVCRASVDVCDLAENCTGNGAACPGDVFAPATTVCRADAGDCDLPETCAGSDPACPPDALEPDTTECDDANACTVNDMCVSGTCTGESGQCGDGTRQASCGEECDDGGTAAGDGCSPTCLVELGLGCTSGPLTGCRKPFVSGKSSLLLAKKSLSSKDMLKWKWLKGERTTQPELGNPLDDTNYQVCVYDQNGLKFEITNPAGGTCAGKPCWRAAGVSGYTYKDKDLTPDGGQKLLLKEGALGKARILFSARGASLAMPDLSTLVQPITVQIQNSGGLCWEAVYSGPPTAQSSSKFSDKAD